MNNSINLVPNKECNYEENKGFVNDDEEIDNSKGDGLDHNGIEFCLNFRTGKKKKKI